jgi:hypothetical protein
MCAQRHDECIDRASPPRTYTQKLLMHQSWMERRVHMCLCFWGVWVRSSPSFRARHKVYGGGFCFFGARTEPRERRIHQAAN